MANQWQWMDINVIGADAFIQNNHVYVTGKNHSMLGELRESIRSSKSDDIMFKESLDQGGRYAFVSQRIKGPAVTVSLGRGSLGAAVSTRLYTSGTGIGSDLARFMYNGLNFPAQHGIRYDDAGVRIVSAAWTEFGLTYARILKARGCRPPTCRR